MTIEDNTLGYIRSQKEGVFQNQLWKDLEIDSRKCSRIIKKLLDAGEITRESAISNGARTYLIKVYAPETAPCTFLMAEDMFSPCTGCRAACQPEYCPLLRQWVENLIKEEQ